MGNGATTSVKRDWQVMHQYVTDSCYKL